MSLVNLIINGKNIQVKEGTTILEAAKTLNIKIPTLCNFKLHDNKTENKPGSCRICVVEVEGRKNLAPSCCTPVTEGMVVNTHSVRAIRARRSVLELLLSDHPKDCLTCEKNTQCELQKIAADIGIRKIKYEGEISTYPLDKTSPALVRDMSKCILCRRCVTMCHEVQTVGAISPVGRGFTTRIDPAFSKEIIDTDCTFCGQCVAVCPTGALTEVNNISKVLRAINDKEKVVIVQTAPAIRAALGEEFGLEPGTSVTGKMVSALRELGFDKVFDTDFAADLTIMEEASEFIERIKNNGPLPMITSCCPGWINFLEHNFTDLIDNPSSCKSPHEMFGAITKTYYAKKMNIDPKNIVVVSVMPCLAKKYEAKRPELSNDGLANVDLVITTRELAKIIKEAGITFESLQDDNFDNPLGESTGAGVIFGTTGGVMEAALRTAYEWLTNKPLENIEFKESKKIEDIKEASIKINDKNINVAIVSGLGNARRLLNEVKAGNCDYHMIEIMACPSGCIDGGGQPYIYGNTDILKKRSQALRKEDKEKDLRKSHENPYIKKLYEEFLGTPNSEKAHKLLHTTFTKR